MIFRIAAICCLLAAPVAADTITSATYTTPTARYAHGILGDAIEWGGIDIIGVQGRWSITLPDALVFEDTAPRLWDVTGDGAPELVLIQSHRDLGARLLVLGMVDGQPAALAATPFIGRTNRWLAPIGAADLDGDGAIEVAYIDRPHLAKTLRVWRFIDGALQPVADLSGLTNHRIGESDIAGGIRDCGQGPQMITANADWSRIMATRLVDGALTTRPIGPHEGRASFAAALSC
ncbi:FG-GAP repeat domain-containing protein [Yoonia sediminilitoris]|uniref:VCBS repeat protein n=1 Tax=Yoonia sediminilitoris TaxID=1286148 RepID=A0A2T6KEV1_9RHOB|nr:VCBS repeat-containing protein [Yoonia sediminilitoris]PUB13653.1 hypothetical protein C8N45_107113 [Yoonia sediminilitoris]RCW94823.1 hypothetical protein DFP92_107113 [Yoonia sediminilitoris]